MLTLKINGRNMAVNAEPDTPLLWVLRGELKQSAPSSVAVSPFVALHRTCGWRLCVLRFAGLGRGCQK